MEPAGDRERVNTQDFLNNLDYDLDECQFWPHSCRDNGYPVMTRNRKTISVHRYICEQVHGLAPDGMEAAHTCGKGSSGCVSPKHLVWKTFSDNQMDRVEHGTSNRGSQNGMSLLTEDDVRSIKKKLANGEYQRDIAEEFSISKATVSMISNGKRWGWVN